MIISRGCLQRVVTIRPSTATSSGRNRNMKQVTNIQSLKKRIDFINMPKSREVAIFSVYLESSKRVKAFRLLSPLPSSDMRLLALLRRLRTPSRLLVNLLANRSPAHSPTLMTQLREKQETSFKALLGLSHSGENQSNEDYSTDDSGYFMPVYSSISASSATAESDGETVPQTC